MIPERIFNPKGLHPDREKVFREDILTFYEKLREYLQDSQVNFKLFKQGYKEFRMHQLHFSVAKGENLKEFYEVLFGEVQSQCLSRIFV